MPKQTRTHGDDNAFIGRQRADVAGQPETAPSQDEIAHRAYDLYRERGATDGHDLDDWLQAERELSGK